MRALASPGVPINQFCEREIFYNFRIAKAASPSNPHGVPANPLSKLLCVTVLAQAWLQLHHQSTGICQQLSLSAHTGVDTLHETWSAHDFLHSAHHLLLPLLVPLTALRPLLLRPPLLLPLPALGACAGPVTGTAPSPIFYLGFCETP